MTDPPGVAAPTDRPHPDGIQRLFQLSHDLMAVATFEGYFVDLNPSWEKVLGWTHAELTAKPFIDFVHPEDRLTTQREAELLQAKGRIVSFENRYRCKDGTYRTLSWNATSHDGYYYAVARDVTEQRRLEELQLHLASIIHSTNDAVVGYDLNGTILSWNPSAERVFGYKAEEIVGRPLATLLPAESLREADEILARIWAGERLDHFETHRVRKDGRRILVSLTVSPIQTADGRIIGASGIARDITERRRIESQLALYTRELERSYADLEQFAYAASHDLQEPLRSISNFSQFLVEDYGKDLPAEAQDYLRRILQGSRRMNEMVKALLRVARAGREHEAPTPVDLNEVLQEIRESLDALLRDRKGHIEALDPLPTLVAHRVRLVDIFTNLISNGLKFNESAHPVVQVRCERMDGRYEFTVEDNGIGIPESQWGELFKLFKRLNAREKYPGTGAGLVLVSKNVQSSGGRIWIERGNLGGARFRFTLPAAVGPLVERSEPGPAAASVSAKVPQR